MEDGFLGIYLTFGSDLGRIACGMIAWFGPGWITFYEEGKKQHYRQRNPGIETSTALRENCWGDYKVWAGNVYRVTWRFESITVGSVWAEIRQRIKSSSSS